jgi:3D (Asp-Asp-Asp) domain-containing protein
MRKKLLTLLFTTVLIINFTLSFNLCTAAGNTVPKKKCTISKRTYLTSRGGYVNFITMRATAYTASKYARTASGERVSLGVVAVDPRVIPLGTKLYVQSLDGSIDYGYAIASDTGGAIKNNKIDLFFNTNSDCYKFGVRNVRVYILGR